ncbi:hypothetical protein [Fibrobacter sp. UWEL]|uniref:hypothetical protein n=1 Tax=Fibrobacter sp. UWEL TaxID=1896209 RepID=UPI00116017A5|nr:hypothetical protein [Fibrobacter sp. UWEL]
MHYEIPKSPDFDARGGTHFPKLLDFDARGGTHFPKLPDFDARGAAIARGDPILKPAGACDCPR